MVLKNRRVFILVVGSRDQVRLIELIKKHVHAGCIVRTDMWKGYKSLMREMDVVDETVNHRQSLNNLIKGILFLNPMLLLRS